MLKVQVLWLLFLWLKLEYFNWENSLRLFHRKGIFCLNIKPFLDICWRLRRRHLRSSICQPRRRRHPWSRWWRRCPRACGCGRCGRWRPSGGTRGPWSYIWKQSIGHFCKDSRILQYSTQKTIDRECWNSLLLCEVKKKVQIYFNKIAL